MNCQKSSFTKWDTDFWQPHSSLLSVNGCAFLLRSSNRFVNLFFISFSFLFWSRLVSIHDFFFTLWAGRKFCQAWKQIFCALRLNSIVLIDNAKVQKIEMQSNSFSRLFFIKCNFVLSNFKIPPARCYAVTPLRSCIYPQRSFIFQCTFMLYYYI